MGRRRATIIGLAVAVTVAVAPTALIRSAAAAPPWCTPDDRGQYAAEDLPDRFSRDECNLDGATIRLGKAAVAAPPAGLTNAAASYGPDGSTELSVGLDRRRVYTISEELDTGTSSDNGSPSDCADPTVGAGTAFRVKTTLNYGIRTSTIPSAVGTTNGVTALRNGHNSILTMPNDCGEARDPNALAHNYTGATATAANFSSTGACGTLDNSNVIEFGALPSPRLGQVCLQWDGGGSLTRWDMRLASGVAWDHTFSDGCNNNNNSWDILSVAVHEWGHIYGLSHVEESTSKWLTMSTAINGVCQTSERTLGRGDMNHMLNKYGVK